MKEENRNINWGVTTEEPDSYKKNEQVYQQQGINWGSTTEENVNVEEVDRNIDWNMSTSKQKPMFVDTYKDDFQNVPTTDYVGNNKEYVKTVDKLPCLELRRLLCNLFNFSGRTRRREYYIGLFQFSGILFILLTVSLKITQLNVIVGGALSIILGLLSLICSLGVCIRRLHDVGKSGKHIFTLLVPVWNLITLCSIYFVNSKEDNRWGMNPKRFDDYVNRPLWKGLVISFIMLILSSIVFGLVGVTTLQDTINQLNARQLYDEMEENYNNMFSEDILETESDLNVEIIDDSWKDELENHKKEDKKDYLWGDDTANYPWTSQPDSIDSIGGESETVQSLEDLLN